MRNWVSYKNGNYTVLFNTKDGTKIRKNDLDKLIPEFPDNCDVKLCNKCTGINCAFCHEGSTPDGELGDIMNAKFIDTLHAGTELALGGGNIFEHPDIIPFLEKLKRIGVIPNITVHQYHFMQNLNLIQKLYNDKLVYGVGVSMVNPNDSFLDAIKTIPTAVIHTIAGIVTREQLETLFDKDMRVLILGYKNFRRGENFFKSNEDSVNKNICDVINMIHNENIADHFKVLSFDNLSVEQLKVHDLFKSKEEWDKFYGGEDGTHTMYIDLVNKKFATSSTSTTRWDLMDNIVDMFNVVREYNGFEVYKNERSE